MHGPLKYLKLTPFDTSTESGRSQERYRLSVWGSIANIASAGLGLLTLIITVPLTLSYLGEERFGVWMTVASLATMLTFLDLGVGNGFVSHIAKIRAQGNFETFKCTVTRGLTLLSFIGMFVGILLCVLNKWLPFETIISVETAQATEDARISAWIFILLFSLSIPSNGIYRIFQGMQKSWVMHALKSISSVVSIISIVVLSSMEAAPYYLLMATYGIQTLMPTILLLYFIKQHWFSRHPHRNWQDAKTEYKHLLDVGGLFFVLQIGTMIGWGSDALIVSSLAGAATVAQLVIVQRLFQVVSIPMSIINTPLWGAYADAKAHKDKNFIAQTLKRSLVGTMVLSALLSIILYLLSGMLLELWIGKAIHVPISLLLGFSIWTVMDATGHSLSMFLNGMHIMKPQVISVIFFCSLALPLKIHYVPEYGAVAVIWSTIFAYLIAVVFYYLYIYKSKIVRAYK